MKSIVEVPFLTILRSSGETHPSNREQPGCIIETKPNNLEAEDKLWQAYQWKDVITLRCAVLDTSGRVQHVRYDDFGGKVYTLQVDDFVCQAKN